VFISGLLFTFILTIIAAKGLPDFPNVPVATTAVVPNNTVFPGEEFNVRFRLPTEKAYYVYAVRRAATALELKRGRVTGTSMVVYDSSKTKHETPNRFWNSSGGRGR